MSHAATQAIIDRHDAYLSPNYPRHAVAMTRGEGAYLWDASGKRYLDLFAGFGAPILGHCHPALVDAVTRQAQQLWHVGNLLHTEPQTRAAQGIVTAAGFDARVFFSHAGADANEAAIKLARLYGKANPRNAPGPLGRYGVISCTRSFHGRSFATMGATGNPKVREGFEPLPAGFSNVAYNDLDALHNAIEDTTIAIIAEPIQGEGGVNVPDPDYFKALRDLCDQRDLLLIADEVWTGCARTGKAFGWQHWLNTDHPPDLFTLGKGVGGGLAVGAMVASAQLAKLYDARAHGVRHATTLGGNCLSMAVTAALFDIIKEQNLTQRAADLEQHIRETLTPCVGPDKPLSEIRGRGLFLGLQCNPQGPTPKAAPLVLAALEQGLLLGSAQGETLRLAPALTIDTQDLDQGLDLLTHVLHSHVAS